MNPFKQFFKKSLQRHSNWEQFVLFKLFNKKEVIKQCAVNFSSMMHHFIASNHVFWSQYDIAPSFHLTLGEVLVQVELEPSAAEAEDFGSLREQAWEIEPILAHWVHQQEGAQLSCLALWKRWGRVLKRSELDRLYLFYQLRNDWLC